MIKTITNRHYSRASIHLGYLYRWFHSITEVLLHEIMIKTITNRYYSRASVHLGYLYRWFHYFMM